MRMSKGHELKRIVPSLAFVEMLLAYLSPVNGVLPTTARSSVR